MKKLSHLFFAVMTCLSVNGLAQAQGFPSKTITIQVPWPAGGATDTTARAMSAELKNQWNQAVVVENTAGAGGSIGTTKALNAPPDGHTMLVSSAIEMIFAPLNYQSAAYTPEDTKTVAMIGYTSMMLVARKDLPANSLGELVAVMQKPTDKPLSYCSPGIGTMYHVVIEQMNHELQTKNLHVPYPGFGQCLTDLAGGVVDFALLPIAGPFPGMVDKGAVKALAVFSDKPNARYPNLPLAKATKGFENANYVLWSAVHVSKKVPDAIVAQINKAVLATMAKPEFRKTVEAMGASLYDPMTPQQAHAYFLKDAQAMESMSKLAGITKK